MLSHVIRSKVQFSKIIFMIGLVLILAILLLPKTVGAEAPNGKWSWTDSKPVVFSSTGISDMAASFCPVAYRMIDIAGDLESKKVCVTSGGKVNFGTTNYYAWTGFTRVIGFGYDSKMYKFRGPCERYDSCLYLPGSDTLVTKQYLINGYVRSLVLYKNFSSRISRVSNGFSTEYNFDSSKPDYIFQNSDNYAWPVGGFGASDNGNWLAVEFRQRGIGLLNVETLQMKRVSISSFSYDTGYNPTTEIAVDDSGQYVAIMGSNAGMTIYGVDSSCGDEANDSNMTGVTLIAQPCKTAQVDTDDFIDRFYEAVKPKFNLDGGELSFYALSYSGESREVSLRASGYGGQRLDYLALGDSYTSGEGETDDRYYLPGTNDEFEKCHVSTRSYPYLLASLSNIDPLYAKSVACSGATTGDILGDDLSYQGQGKRLGKDKLNLNEVDIILAKTQAKYSFVPGRTYQSDFVKEYKPKVITIGIGGNDAGLMDKLKDCAIQSTCNWASEPKKKEQTALEIKGVFDKLVKTYKEIIADSPGSKIYAIGYPKIIEAKGKCDVVTGSLFDETEREFMNESIIYLNEIVATASNAAGIKYIDVQDSYGDQVLCGSKSPNAVSGVRTGDDTNLMNDSQWFRFIGSEGFHPNNFGHALVADSINNSVKNLSDFDYCGSTANTCPDDTIVAPEPSSYWVPEKYHDYPSQHIATFVSDEDNSADNKKKELDLGSYSLEPNSQVDVEITSDPISLGQFVAGSDGSFHASVDLPNNLTEGYHTIHLYGTSYSGESIELYQIIKYELPVIKPDTAVPDFTNKKINSSGVPNGLDIFDSQSQGKNIIGVASSSVSDNFTEHIASATTPEVKGASTVAKKFAKSYGANTGDEFPINVSVILVSSLVFICVVTLVIRAQKVKE